MKHTLVAIILTLAFIPHSAEALKPPISVKPIWVKTYPLLAPITASPLQTKEQLTTVIEKTNTGAYSGSHEDWMAAAGISPSDYGYVDYIVSRESGWNPEALNPIGACSLVQALPCSKIPGDWRNPVDALKWQQGYVNARFGGYAGAVAYWGAHGSY